MILAGREWAPKEDEERARIIGSASRTQVGRRSSAGGWVWGGGETHERKRKDSDLVADGIEVKYLLIRAYNETNAKPCPSRDFFSHRVDLHTGVFAP